MKKIIRICNECKKESKYYIKIHLVVNLTHESIIVRTIDLCKECALERFPELKRSRRRGLQDEKQRS